MKTAYHPGVHRYAVFVFFWTVLLLVAGALVTSKDAALSVPDWPTSYGTFLPPMVGGVLYEDSHRKIAGALGILLIIEAVVIWRYEERRWLRWFALAAVGGVIAQAILGGQVVMAAGVACVLRADYVCGDFELGGFYQQMVDGRAAGAR